MFYEAPRRPRSPRPSDQATRAAGARARQPHGPPTPGYCPAPTPPDPGLHADARIVPPSPDTMSLIPSTGAKNGQCCQTLIAGSVGTLGTLAPRDLSVAPRALTS